jgi:hypothetical protein
MAVFLSRPKFSLRGICHMAWLSMFPPEITFPQGVLGLAFVGLIRFTIVLLPYLLFSQTLLKFLSSPRHLMTQPI